MAVLAHLSVTFRKQYVGVFRKVMLQLFLEGISPAHLLFIPVNAGGEGARRATLCSSGWCFPRILTLLGSDPLWPGSA